MVLAMDEVSQIRERIDLASFISEYIPLKKMGRNFKAICPFHNEKTPSFIVSPERQIWHCFGSCSKGGDVYTFLMEYENLEFVEALRILAKRTGVNLRQSNFQVGVSGKKETIYQLNKIALDFYHYVLTKHKVGKKALSYLTNVRKLDTRLIETFMLGFSPKEGVSLSNYLINKKKYKKEDLIEAGLSFYRGPSAGSGQRGVVDFFRGRIIFPLFDHRDNVVGFSGRAIEDPPAGGGGKYINTRDTLVYHKGDMFFGLNSAKNEIKKLDKAIIVEGELDVISCFSIGIKNVVAVKGTALTENQVGLISRFTNNICLCFDQDDAGYEATKRSLPVLEKKGINITTCIFDKVKDADEAIKKDAISFKKSIKKDIPIYDFIFSKTISLSEKDRVYGKRKISETLLPIFTRISNEIVKEHYLKKLSLDLDVSLDALLKEVEKIEKKEVVKEIPEVKIEKKDRRNILEDYLLALILQNENTQKVLERSLAILKDYEFETVSYKKIIDFLVDYFRVNKAFDARKFLKVLPKELTTSFDSSYLFPLANFENDNKYIAEIEKIAAELRILFLKDRIKKISLSLTTEEKDQDIKKVNDLEKELASTILLLSKSQNVVK